MKYAETRSQIKSGDVLAWTHKGWGSWYDIQVQAVRVFTRSEYAHVGVAWVVGGRVFVIEAAVPKVRIYPLSKLGSFYWIKTDEYWNSDVEEYALSLVGAEYSKMEAIMAFFNAITPGKNTKWQCSELVNTIIIKGNLIEDQIQSTPTATVEKLQQLGCPVYLIEN